MHTSKLGFRPIPTLIALAVTIVMWFLPTPEGLTLNGMRLCAIFVGTIVGIIGKAMPIGALSIISIAVVAMTQVTVPDTAKNPSKQAITDALSSFSNALIWLIAISVIISRGVIKTGLGRRLAYYFIALFGKKTIGIAYAMSFSELLLAPFTPSNTARGGGILHPIMKSIAQSFDSDPEKGTQKKIGRFLALSTYQANGITSAMFVTATAPNPLVLSILNKHFDTGFQLTWTTWAVAMFIPGLLCLLLTPLLTYFIYPPEIKTTPQAKEMAKNNLQALGKLSLNEWIMVGVFVMLIVLWADIPALIFGEAMKINPATTAIFGLSVLLITGVLTWDDVKEEKSAWDTLIWFSALIMMATFLSKIGVIGWFANNMEEADASLGLPWFVSMILLVGIYLFSHYSFASTTAHVTAMLAAFYIAGISLGIPPVLYGLLLAAASSIMMSITHYATGTAPVIFSSNYTTLGEWWILGFVSAMMNMIIFIIFGTLWWKLLGYI